MIPAIGDDHKWSEWIVIKPATAKTAGEKQHTCEICGSTENGKISPVAAPKITATIKKGAKSVIVKWKKVSGAKSYQVAYRKVGSKKWTYKNTTKLSCTVKGLKKGGLYVFRVANVSFGGSAWSNAQNLYLKSAKIKAKAGKRSVKVTWKKVKVK